MLRTAWLRQCRAVFIVSPQLNQVSSSFSDAAENRARQVNGSSVPRRMRAALSGSVQLAQAATKRFDFLLVRGLLPLGQLEGLKHCLHIVEGGAERLDDLIDLFDCLRNDDGSPGLGFAGWWRERFPELTHWRPGSFPRLVHLGWRGLPHFLHWRRSSRLLGRDGFRTGLHRLGCPCRRCERYLDRGAGASPPAASVPTPAAPAAWRRSRSSRLLGLCVFRARCFFGSHAGFKLPLTHINAMGIIHLAGQTTGLHLRPV